MKNITVFVFLLIFLSGCSHKNILLPQAEDVRIYDELPTNLRCDYKDEIVSSEGTWLTFIFVSNRDLTIGSRNDLRNQAVKLGGNTVITQSSVFTYTTSTVFVGQVYDCNLNLE